MKMRNQRILAIHRFARIAEMILLEKESVKYSQEETGGRCLVHAVNTESVMGGHIAGGRVMYGECFFINVEHLDSSVSVLCNMP